MMPCDKEHEELIKLYKMVCSFQEGLEEPNAKVQAQWDAVTASYVEELEQILASLHNQAGEVAFAMISAKGGRA